MPRMLFAALTTIISWNCLLSSVSAGLSGTYNSHSKDNIPDSHNQESYNTEKTKTNMIKVGKYHNHSNDEEKKDNEVDKHVKKPKRHATANILDDSPSDDENNGISSSDNDKKYEVNKPVRGIPKTIMISSDHEANKHVNLSNSDKESDSSSDEEKESDNEVNKPAIVGLEKYHSNKNKSDSSSDEEKGKPIEKQKSKFARPSELNNKSIFHKLYDSDNEKESNNEVNKPVSILKTIMIPSDDEENGNPPVIEQEKRIKLINRSSYIPLIEQEKLIDSGSDNDKKDNEVNKHVKNQKNQFAKNINILLDDSSDDKKNDSISIDEWGKERKERAKVVKIRQNAQIQYNDFCNTTYNDVVHPTIYHFSQMQKLVFMLYGGNTHDGYISENDYIKSDSSDSDRDADKQPIRNQIYIDTDSDYDDSDYDDTIEDKINILAHKRGSNPDQFLKTYQKLLDFTTNLAGMYYEIFNNKITDESITLLDISKILSYKFIQNVFYYNMRAYKHTMQPIEERNRYITLAMTLDITNLINTLIKTGRIQQYNNNQNNIIVEYYNHLYHITENMIQKFDEIVSAYIYSVKSEDIKPSTQEEISELNKSLSTWKSLGIDISEAQQYMKMKALNDQHMLGGNKESVISLSQLIEDMTHNIHDKKITNSTLAETLNGYFNYCRDYSSYQVCAKIYRTLLQMQVESKNSKESPYIMLDNIKYDFPQAALNFSSEELNDKEESKSNQN